MPRKPIPPQVRFNKFVSKTKTDKGCIEWLGAKTPTGYGVFHMPYGTIQAHRLVMIFAGMDPSKGTHVLHSCDNPACVNIEHLREGSHAENMRDMANRGRSKPSVLKGQNHPKSKLTEHQAIEILKRSKDGEGQRALAREFSVNQGTIWKLINGENWAHLHS